MSITTSVWSANVARRHDEDDLQRSVVEFLKWALPDDAVYFHVPNGGQRHKRAAQRLVGLGTRAGIPDLVIIHRGRVLCIELKTARGSLSASQRQMHQRLTYAGAEVVCCRSLEGVQSALIEMGVPLRVQVSL